VKHDPNSMQTQKYFKSKWYKAGRPSSAVSKLGSAYGNKIEREKKQWEMNMVHHYKLLLGPD
jgi:hypothetical protein